MEPYNTHPFMEGSCHEHNVFETHPRCCVTRGPSFLLPNSIPWYDYTTVCLSIVLLLIFFFITIEASFNITPGMTVCWKRTAGWRVQSQRPDTHARAPAGRPDAHARAPASHTPGGGASPGSGAARLFVGLSSPLRVLPEFLHSHLQRSCLEQ